ncbi:MAG TPA: cob(I)yrinic acid a,c-diamide adenosyltransferase [Kiritimatiellia bacterium]|nr:cob(I)yrinic acid a,c-diamide adenosyltransferase [Kiritimatiellia bacterium]HRU70155.1 cob(I)yrinic acid a,c-diamide adenosyltransferase [Kiritimatiellia bacterium]
MNPKHANRVILLTGDGKGKTSSALGMVLRAVGHGLRVCVVQFIKRRVDTGEAQALRLLPGVEHLVCGNGFVRERTGEAFEAHARAARDGLARAAERLCDPAYGMVVLDEVCGAVALGLLDVQAVVEALAKAAPGKAVVLTGRDAPPALTALADTVSVVTCVKHAYDHGAPAQRGVEW